MLKITKKEVRQARDATTTWTVGFRPVRAVFASLGIFFATAILTAAGEVFITPYLKGIKAII